MPDFSNTRSILSRRPRILFVEPDQVPGEQSPTAPTPPAVELLERKEQLQTVVKQYQRLEQLSDLAQKRIDAKAKDVKMCLDPEVDSHVIASLQRKFGDVTPCVTYEQYKICVQQLSALGQKAAVTVTPEDLAAAAADPNRTSFGGYTKETGAMRPELQYKSPVKPISMDKFQKDGTKKLFKMLLPMITKLTDSKILTHLLTAPHS